MFCAQSEFSGFPKSFALPISQKSSIILGRSKNADVKLPHPCRGNHCMLKWKKIDKVVEVEVYFFGVVSVYVNNVVYSSLKPQVIKNGDVLYLLDKNIPYKFSAERTPCIPPSKTFSTLDCEICSCIMARAHNLQCGHTFCFQCIQTWIKEKEASATCPVCRCPTSLEAIRPVWVLDKMICEIVQTQRGSAKKDYAKRINQQDAMHFSDLKALIHQSK
eukprot:Platyproteum_vivax@DN5405_c0_g1_i1.p1